MAGSISGLRVKKKFCRAKALWDNLNTRCLLKGYYCLNKIDEVDWLNLKINAFYLKFIFDYYLLFSSCYYYYDLKKNLVNYLNK